VVGGEVAVISVGDELMGLVLEEKDDADDADDGDGDVAMVLKVRELRRGGDEDGSAEPVFSV